MNSILKRVIGESEDPALDTLLGRDEVSVSDPIDTANDKALNTILGRPGGDDETRELQIGHEMLTAISLLPPDVQQDVAVTVISGLANELISMHQST